jgi:hypothetical protein
MRYESVNNSKFFFSLFLILWLGSTALAQNKVDKAIDILITLCVAGGETVEIGSNDSDLKIASSDDDSQVNVKKSQYRGLIGGLSKELTKLSSEQADSARECLRPYIDRILVIVLEEVEEKPEGEQTTEIDQSKLVLEDFIYRLSSSTVDFQMLSPEAGQAIMAQGGAIQRNIWSAGIIKKISLSGNESQGIKRYTVDFENNTMIWRIGQNNGIIYFINVS